MLKLEKLGGRSNMATYRPGKYEDDEIRKNINHYIHKIGMLFPNVCTTSFLYREDSLETLGF